MSTNATIEVEGVNHAIVYKHWNGYPEATLPWLKKFNEEFTGNRGDDPDYKFAQLLRSSVNDAAEFNLDTSKETGWGVYPYKECNSFDYHYILKADGSVVVES